MCGLIKKEMCLISVWILWQKIVTGRTVWVIDDHGVVINGEKKFA
jgi:hypothetical protein